MDKKITVQKDISAKTFENGDVKKLVKGRNVDMLFCVPQLFACFGYNIENKIYSADDFVELCQILNISLLVQLNSFNFQFGEFVSFDTALLLHLESYEHAISLTYANTDMSNDMLQISKLAVASNKQILGKKKRNKNPVTLPVGEKFIKREVVNARKKKNKRKEEKVEKEVIVREEVKPLKPVTNIATYGMHPRKYQKNFVQNVSDSAPAKRNYCAGLIKMLTDPYSCMNPLRYPDGLAKNVSVLKQWANISYAPPFTGTVANGNYVSYPSIIHCGTTKTQYLLNTFLLPPNVDVVIADLTSTSAKANSALADFVDSGAANRTFPARTIDATTTIIPLRSGISTFPSSATTDVNSASLSTVFLQPGEVILPNGSIVPKPTNITSSFPGDSALALSSQMRITVEFSGNILTSGTLTFSAVLGSSPIGSISTSTIGAYSLSTGSVTSVASVIIPTSRTCLYSLRVSNSAGCVMSWDWIKVTITTSDFQVENLNDTIYQPYSWYLGYECLNRKTIADIAEQERCTASAILYTDVTNLLTVNGVITVSQINSGTYPAETGIYGTRSAANAACTLALKEKSGFYSAPFKLNEIDTVKFNDHETDWYGASPYTVCYARIPAQITARVQICDIFELKTNSQQILARKTQSKNEAIEEWIKEILNESMILTENPLHLKMIGQLIKKGFNALPKYLPHILPLINALL